MNPSGTSAVKWFRSEYLVPVMVLVAAICMLTPRGFEPGGESWNAWAAARVLSESGGFPVISRNPLYVAYLTLFVKLPFPASLILEYWITHLFVLLAVHALVRDRLSPVKSIILIVVLAPLLGIVEGGGTLAAVGFFSLYLRNYVASKQGTWPFLPATLLAAALCHSAYLPFVVLHLLVSGFFILRSKSHATSLTGYYGNLRENLLLLLLVGFVLAALLLQSNRADNNHMLMDPRFAPIPLSGAINIAFFQIKTWGLVDRAYDPSILYLKDWYFETPRFFGSSKTIFEVLRNNPDLFFSVVFQDISAVALIPLYLYSFYSAFSHPSTVIVFVSMLLLLMLLIGMYKIYRIRGMAPVLILSAGCGSITAAFLLTWFSFRYMVTLLPIFLLAYTHYLGDTESSALTSIFEYRWLKNAVFFIGCSLLFSSAPFAEAHYQRIEAECKGENNATVLSKVFAVACKKWKRLHYQIGAVADNRWFLTREGGVSISTAYPILSRLIEENPRILSLEHTFFAGFTKVGIDNNNQVWSLPPYDDKTEFTHSLLDKIDVFFVSDNWTTNSASASTQSYLRYKLHVLPYLNARISEFNTIQIPRYGYAYVRKKTV